MYALVLHTYLISHYYHRREDLWLDICTLVADTCSFLKSEEVLTQNVHFTLFRSTIFNKKLKMLLGNLLLHVKNILGAVRDALSASLSS